MNKKGLKITTESNNWNRSYLINKLEEDFVKFLRDSNQEKEMIKNAEKIDWGRLVSVFILESNDLAKKLDIPRSAFEFIALEDILEFIILEYLKHQLYYILFFHLCKVKKADNTSRKEKIINSMLKRAEANIKESMELFKLQLDISNLKWIKDTDKIKSEAEKLQKLAEKGGLFSRGKQNRPVEIPHFEAIEKDYSKLKGTKLEKSYRSLAIYVARHDLELEHEQEHINFYNRFLIWHKKHLKKK